MELVLSLAIGVLAGAGVWLVLRPRTFQVLIGLSLLTFVPAVLMAMTSFTRIVITLSFVRHALGLPETPPNAVLITIAAAEALENLSPDPDGSCTFTNPDPLLSSICAAIDAPLWFCWSAMAT